MDDPEERKVPTGILPIRDSSGDYRDGGVLEASRFAKGDGWKPDSKEE